MSYRHATVRTGNQDLASGFVLHSAPGFPAFPVRLASEIFQRALALRGGERPAALWDPCCGGGYLVTVLGLLHRDRVASVLASDLDPAAVELAGRNLALLGANGLVGRAAELVERAERFGKPVYGEAARAAGRLATGLEAGGGALPYAVRQADVFDPGALREALGDMTPDIVVTDVPYGEQAHWLGPGAAAGVAGVVSALAEVLPGDGVIAVTVRARKVPLDQGPRPRSTFRIGTRAVALWAVRDAGRGSA